MGTSSVPVIDFVVLGGFVVLLVLAGIQLAVIWAGGQWRCYGNVSHGNGALRSLWLASLIVAITATAGCGQSAPQESGAEDVVAQREYGGMPDREAEQVQGGTTRVVDGALVITVERAKAPIYEFWALPETDSASVTAFMGAPSETEAPRGFWFVMIGDRDRQTGVFLICWADGPPPELVDLSTREVLLVIEDGKCDGPSEMTLRLDNPDSTGASMITVAAGGSEKVAFLGGERYQPRDAGYSVQAVTRGFSVELTSLLVTSG